MTGSELNIMFIDVACTYKCDCFVNSLRKCSYTIAILKSHFNKDHCGRVYKEFHTKAERKEEV